MLGSTCNIACPNTILNTIVANSLCEYANILEKILIQRIPSVCAYSKSLTDTALNKKSLICDIDCNLEISLVKKLSSLNSCLDIKIEKLNNSLLESKNFTNPKENAEFYRDNIKAQMQELRAIADELETIVSKEFWPFPTYADLLFSI